MIPVGSFVKFVWWSDYRAPSAEVNEKGRTTWHTLRPGDTGIVLCSYEDGTVIVIFSSVDSLLRLPSNMLDVIV